MAEARGREVKSLKKNIIRIQNSPLWFSGRYSAWVRQMYFELYRCRFSEAIVNRVIGAIATTLGITLGKQPSSKIQARLRLEDGCWAQLCAAAAMAEAKAKTHADTSVFTMCEGRDTTTERGCHFQVHSFPVSTRSGPMHLMNDAPLVHNKTAAQQFEHTRQVRTTIVRLSQGLVEPNAEVECKIAESANNELAINKLEESDPVCPVKDTVRRAQHTMALHYKGETGAPAMTGYTNLRPFYQNGRKNEFNRLLA